MTGLTVDADIAAATDLLGKSVTDLQSDVAIGEYGISGTLKYVTGYTGFSGDTNEQKGNYIALHFAVTDHSTAAIRVKLTNGNNPDFVTLDSDGILIARVQSAEQEIIVETSLAGYKTAIKRIALNGLTLESEA